MAHVKAKRSGFEYRIAEDLQARDIEYGYETVTVEFRTRVKSGVCGKCGCKEVYQRRTYTPDFVIPRSAGSILYVEAKGILDSKTRSKMRDVKRANPDLDIRILFDGKGSWARSRTNARWAEKYGFPFHFGHEVPESWL